MNRVRQLLILAMIPLTAWTGLPHVACRCSSGEIRLFCPRLGQAKSNDAACANKSQYQTGKSCCGASSKSCCSANKMHSEGSQCCADGCRCTPAYVQGDSGPALKKVVAPELLAFEFTLPQAVVVTTMPRMVRVDIRVLEQDQRVPDDLIILCERWLI